MLPTEAVLVIVIAQEMIWTLVAEAAQLDQMGA
jgi:hypothetical protein